jgi:hypothetical protein
LLGNAGDHTRLPNRWTDRATAITIINVKLDPVAVATVNGTVLTIYEVVLAAFLGRSVIAFSELMAAAQELWQHLSDYRLEDYVAYLQREPWSEYKTNAREGRKGLNFDRLDQLINKPSSKVGSDDGKQYICTIMAMAAQYPYPTKVRGVKAGGIEHIELNLEPSRSPFDSANAVEEWTRLVSTISLWLRTVTSKALNRDKALLDAAESARPDSRQLFEPVVQFLDYADDQARNLRSRLDRWQARHPGPWTRRALVAGFVMGGIMFVVGVLVPITLGSRAPYWLYQYIPAAWYLCVLVAITWAGVLQSIRA